MSLLTSSIDLDAIAPPTAEVSQFNSSQIENLANLFLQAGDTVRPILLRKISPISFQILEGYFEYYAAMKAQEIDEQFTAIRAYVVPPNLESTILAQYQFLRSLSLPTTIEKTVEPPTNQQLDLAQIEKAIANSLEQKLAATIDRIVEERISSSFQAFATQMTQQLDTHLLDFKKSLASVNIDKIAEPMQPPDLSSEQVPQKAIKTKAPAKTKSKPAGSATAKKTNLDDNNPKALQVLNDLNTMNFADLERKLAQSKNGKFARPIHELQSEQKFQSIKDVISKVQGLAEKTMQRIIDAW
jgi:hypothetical protein